MRTMQGTKRGLFMRFFCFDEQLQRPEPPPRRPGSYTCRSPAPLSSKHGPHVMELSSVRRRDVLRQLLDRHARLDVAHVDWLSISLIEGNVARA